MKQLPHFEQFVVKTKRNFDIMAQDQCNPEILGACISHAVGRTLFNSRPITKPEDMSDGKAILSGLANNN